MLEVPAYHEVFLAWSDYTHLLIEVNSKVNSVQRRREGAVINRQSCVFCEGTGLVYSVVTREPEAVTRRLPETVSVFAFCLKIGELSSRPPGRTMSGRLNIVTQEIEFEVLISDQPLFLDEKWFVPSINSVDIRITRRQCK